MMSITADAFNITPRQREALDFITRYIAAHKTAPSYRDMAAALQCTQSSVSRLVNGLIERGMLIKHGRLPRSLTLLSEPAKSLPQHLHARLARYCAEHGEDFDAVISDAVTLHLDAMDRIHEHGLAVVVGGGDR